MIVLHRGLEVELSTERKAAITGAKNIFFSGNMAKRRKFSLKSRYVMQNVFAGHDVLKTLFFPFCFHVRCFA